MAQEGNNENDDYYIPIQTRSGGRIVNPNRFGQAAAIALGLLTFQCNAFLQHLRPRKVNKNSPTDQTEGANYRSIEKNLYPQRDQVGAISRQNNNSSSSMAREGDNDNDEYYIPIQTRSGRRIFQPNRFVQASAIALGLLTFQCNAFLQTLRPGSIETIKNELENVTISKATMDHMDLISRNSNDVSINLVHPTCS